MIFGDAIDPGMARGPNEDADLSFVKELIFAPRGLDLERFSRVETLAGRTPDFRVIRDGRLLAHCEVKSPRDDWLDDQLPSAPSGQIVGGLRKDPTFNTLARHIAKGATQFDAVNKTRTVPNVLVFVNHAAASHGGDLEETLTGAFRAASGRCYATLWRISEGWIAKSKRQIDLYVWVDVGTRKEHFYLIHDLSPDHTVRVSELFGLAA